MNIDQTARDHFLLGVLETILDHWHMGIFVFSSESRELLANAAGRRIAAAADGFTVASNGPLAARAQETRLLRESLRALFDGRSHREWLRLTRPSGDRAYELALHRVMTAEGVVVVVFITAPDGLPAIDSSALRKLHGLTDLEGRVAACLAQGLHVREIAAAQGLSVETARWYVQQVRLKLDAASQGDVVRFLIGSVTSVQDGIGPSIAAKN